MKNKLLILLLFLFIINVVKAQCNFTGIIYDTDKTPLLGVQIMLSINDSLVAASITDINGKFNIKKLHKGKYLLMINYPGYTAIEEERDIQGNNNVEITLYREINVELAGVEVVANRNDVVKRTATGFIYQLSDQAKNCGDPYRALKEIPQLISNEATQTLRMDDGNTPMILIDGNLMNSGITPINPKDIESVEVVDVVNSRYLQMGVKNIVNIKLKERTAPYTFFQAATRHDIPLRYGMGVVYFEVGNQTFSLYGRASFGYTHHDDSRINSWQQDTEYYKQSNGKNRKNGNDKLGELLFKWRPMESDFMAFHIYGKQIRSKINTWGSGIYATDESYPFDYTSKNRDDSYILTGSIYHKHTFSNNKRLESTLAFNKNGNDNNGEREESYPDWLYQNIYEFDNNRTSGSLNVDYSCEWNDVNSLNIGSETTLIKDKINRIRDKYPIFHHRKWNEYMYAVFSSKTNKLFYMLSLGIEGIWLKSGDVSNGYFKPRAAVSGTYQLNSNNSMRLSYTLTNEAPTVGQLNPYNTSTDSLVVARGNPELLPMQNHILRASYTFNKKGFSITPSVTYRINRDIIEPFGYIDNGIYTSTYVNRGKSERLAVGGSISYRIKKWGRIYGSAYHSIDYFEGQNPKRSFSCSGGFNADYKKWSLIIDVEYMNFEYTALSLTKHINPTYSQVQLIYNLTKKFYISMAMPYFIGTMTSETNTHVDTYYSHLRKRMTSMSGRPWVLLRYTFRKNDKQKIKLNNVVRSKEAGISLQ